MIAEEPSLEPTVLCSNCRWRGSASASFCRRCGAPRPLPEAPSSTVIRPRGVLPEMPVNDRWYASPTEDASPAEPQTAQPRATVVDAADLIAPRVPCPRCGISVSRAARFCGGCGFRRREPLWRPKASGPGPELRADRTVSNRQKRALVATGGIAGLCLLIAPFATLTVAIGLATAMYLATLAYRLLMFWAALRAPETLLVQDAEARAIPARQLPIYTILVPAYREPEVIANLLTSLRNLEYPAERLDIKLLLEADDPETLAAAMQADPGPNVEILRVLPSEPRTKPKACNVGLGRARGKFVTIYDAEDRPDPLQLRRAVAAFKRLPPQVACIQAKLSFHNAEQNLLTRWFTAEYALWFGQLLPGLIKLGAPLPLGGTSNHFRRETLVRVGGWDPFNVTEDADLGVRIHRLGYRTAVLESTTMEEANSDFVNWTKQRSRWYKGYLQTWLVHMRHPRQLWHQIGPKGFVGFNLFVGGTPMLALLNPIFWALTALWFLAKPPFILALFPAWLYYASLLTFALGNFTFLYTGVVGARAAGRPSLALAALLSPAYWVMMSVAAIKAGVQLLATPTFWEKTTHGLDVEPIAHVSAQSGST
jgi:cellulose synthase/poly-beta-1,6-N-acetylglucosamine synthase-like glycosyltransferase